MSSVGSNASDGGPVADATASASEGVQRQRSALRLALRTKPVGNSQWSKVGSATARLWTLIHREMTLVFHRTIQSNETLTAQAIPDAESI